MRKLGFSVVAFIIFINFIGAIPASAFEQPFKFNANNASEGIIKYPLEIKEPDKPSRIIDIYVKDPGSSIPSDQKIILKDPARPTFSIDLPEGKTCVNLSAENRFFKGPSTDDVCVNVIKPKKPSGFATCLTLPCF